MEFRYQRLVYVRVSVDEKIDLNLQGKAAGLALFVSAPTW
jgi:hypothetical protein